MKLRELTKEQWLKRCETVYEFSKSHPMDLNLLMRTVDAIMRLEWIKMKMVA